MLPLATAVPAPLWIMLAIKEIIWFEHSGHTPWVSESDRFVQAMVDTVLAQTQGSGS